MTLRFCSSCSRRKRSRHTSRFPRESAPSGLDFRISPSSAEPIRGLGSFVPCQVRDNRLNFAATSTISGVCMLITSSSKLGSFVTFCSFFVTVPLSSAGSKSRVANEPSNPSAHSGAVSSPTASSVSTPSSSVVPPAKPAGPSAMIPLRPRAAIRQLRGCWSCVQLSRLDEDRSGRPRASRGSAAIPRKPEAVQRRTHSLRPALVRDPPSSLVLHPSSLPLVPPPFRSLSARVARP